MNSSLEEVQAQWFEALKKYINSKIPDAELRVLHPAGENR
jgi:hypothetical protein